MLYDPQYDKKILRKKSKILLDCNVKVNTYSMYGAGVASGATVRNV